MASSNALSPDEDDAERASSASDASSVANAPSATAGTNTSATGTPPKALANKKQQAKEGASENSLDDSPSFEAIVNAPSSASESVAVPATTPKAVVPPPTTPAKATQSTPPVHIAPATNPSATIRATSRRRGHSSHASRKSQRTPSSRRASAVAIAPTPTNAPEDVLAPTKERMGEMSGKQLMKALKRAIKARRPAAVDLYVCLHETHSDDVDLEKHVTPQQARKLVLIALYAVRDGPTRLVTILRSLVARERSPVQIDALYTKDRERTPSVSAKRRGFFGFSRKHGQRRTLPYLIAGNSQLSTKEKREWLDVVLDDPEVGPHFDLNRNVDGAGGNLLLRSYTKLHIPDPKWYTYLIEKRHVAVNTHGPHNETLKGYLQSGKQKGQTTPLEPAAIDEVLECLSEHGGKTIGELML